MGDFKRKSFGGNDRGGFKKRGFGGGFGGKRGGFGDRRPTQMYPVVCAKCQKNTEVPFRPTGDKPVLCRECFGPQKSFEPRNDFKRRDSRSEFPRRNEGNEQLNKKIELIESKLDSILEILKGLEVVEEEVVEEKPVKKSKKK